MYPICQSCKHRWPSVECAGCRPVPNYGGYGGLCSPSNYEQDPDAPRIVVTSQAEGGV